MNYEQLHDRRTEEEMLQLVNTKCDAPLRCTGVENSIQM